MSRVIYEVDHEKCSYKDAIRNVAKVLMSHWTERNIYTSTLKYVISELTKHVDEYRDLIRVHESGE